MQEMEKVLGHEEVIKHLQNAAAMDKVCSARNTEKNRVCSAVPVRKP